MKISTVFVLIMFFLVSFHAPLSADMGSSTLDSSKFLHLLIKIISKAELNDIQRGLEKWRDPEISEKLSDKFIDDRFVEKLYIRFRFIMIDPSSARGSEKAVRNLERFGKTLHNMLYSMRKEELAEYGTLISIMRDIAYLEAVHIPMAVEHDESRKKYWYQIHDEWVKELETKFKTFLAAGDETDKK